MPFSLRSALSDLLRRRRDPLSVLTWVGIPLFTAVIMNLLFGGSQAPAPKARLLVADLDRSTISRSFVSGIGQSPVVIVANASLQDGRARIAAGEASALLVIPDGLGAAFIAGRPAQMQLLTNPAQRILPAILEQTVSIGMEIAEQRRAAVMASMRSATPGVGDPSLIEVVTRTIDPRPRQNRSFAASAFPGLLFMAVLFVAQGLASEIWLERAQGVLRRMASLPRQFDQFLIGRLVSAGLLLALLGTVALAGGKALLNMPVHSGVLAVAWIVVSGAVLFLLMLLFQLHSSTERAGNTYTSIGMLVLAMLGGSFFPFDFMPAAFVRIGRVTPNGWALTELQAILSGASQPWTVGISFGGFVLLGVVLFTLARRRLLGGFAI